MKTKISGIILFLLFLIPLFWNFMPVLVSAQEKAEIHFFWSSGCPYCAKEEKFLDELQKNHPQLDIKKYEFSKNIGLIKKFYQDYDVLPQEQGLVPATFTPSRYFIGFNEQIGREIEGCIRECLIGEEPFSSKISIPIFGQINIKEFSLPLLAVVIGFFDGFNICSLGALILILGLVIALKSKKKILIFGGTFILITIIVYWFLVFLWSRLFVFIAPHIRRMEILIGLLALVGGWYFLKEFLNSRKRGAVCNFGGFSSKLADKVRNVFEKKAGLPVMLAAIVFFAVAVTIVEFPCTAFFPVLFTGILAQTNTSFYLSLLYISIYVFFYMLDEFIIFFTAVFTFKIWGASPKFIIWFNLAASAILILFGFYYLLGSLLI